MNFKLLFKKTDKEESPGRIEVDLNKFQIKNPSQVKVSEKLNELLSYETFKKSGDYILYADQINREVNYSSRSILFGPRIIALHIFDKYFDLIYTYLFKKENDEYFLLNEIIEEFRYNDNHYYSVPNSKYKKLKYDNISNQITFKELHECYFSNPLLQVDLDEVSMGYKLANDEVTIITSKEVLYKAISYELKSVEKCQCYSVGPFVVGKKFTDGLRYEFDSSFIINSELKTKTSYDYDHLLETDISIKVLSNIKMFGVWNSFYEYTKNPLEILSKSSVTQKEIDNAIRYEISRFEREKMNHSLLQYVSIDSEKKFYEFIKMRTAIGLEPGRYATLDWENEEIRKIVQMYFEFGIDIDLIYELLHD